MVAFLFLFMVALEKMWERMENYYHAHFSKRPEQVNKNTKYTRVW
jgi:hypothetical protein